MVGQNDKQKHLRQSFLRGRYGIVSTESPSISSALMHMLHISYPLTSELPPPSLS